MATELITISHSLYYLQNNLNELKKLQVKPTTKTPTCDTQKLDKISWQITLTEIKILALPYKMRTWREKSLIKMLGGAVFLYNVL